MNDEGPVAREIREKLAAAFELERLDVLDESEQHRGHAGYTEGGQSHFRIRLQGPAFAKMTRIARHRAVHAALGSDLIARIHALAIEIDIKQQ